MPSLFGEPGRPVSGGYVASSIARACVAREFAAFATNKNRPVSQFLRALARALNASTPGKGVGVIGQCFTGGFALAAAVDDSVRAPVLSQPSVPIPLTLRHRRDPGLSEAELNAVADRATNQGLCAMGLRFLPRLHPGKPSRPCRPRTSVPVLRAIRPGRWTGTQPRQCVACSPHAARRHRYPGAGHRHHSGVDGARHIGDAVDRAADQDHRDPRIL
jgi:hypothetical protein